MDYNLPEEVEKRAMQEDPIVMYLIIKESLGMSAGKTAAQCSHAACSLVQNYFLQKENIRGAIQSGLDILYDFGFTEESFIMMQEWFKGSYRKVVLRASDGEFEKVKNLYQEKCVVIIDNGLTEIAAGSETCIGLFPQRKSQRDKVIKRLQALK